MKLINHTGYNPCGRQRMAAKVKKIIVNADPVDAENLRPYFSHLLFLRFCAEP